MQIVDMEARGRKKQFDWFNSFPDPTYSLNVRTDVTNVVRHAKQHGKSFFIEMLYLVTEALNSVPEMRMRIKGDDAVIFDTINPAYTVAAPDGNFENCRHQMTDDYQLFYARAAENIEQVKAGTFAGSAEFNDLTVLDEYYISCLPWIDFTAVTQPQPVGNRESMSIPKISWGKYVEEAGRLKLTMHVTADHSLVDGRPLSFSLLHLQELIDRIDMENPDLPAW